MHGIKVLMAKNYIDNLSEETSKGMLEKARQGLYPSNAPFGYVNITDSNLRKIILPHPLNGPLVTQIYAWYASGEYSLSGIYDRLNNEFSSVFENKRKMTRSCVHKLLTNPIYYGDFVWNGEYYRGTHDPLISRELFEAVQEVLTLHGKRRMAQKTHRFAFKGLIRCGHCGCAMVAELKKGKYIYYHCTQNKGKCPGGVSIPESEIDRQFAMSLEAIQMPPEAVVFVVDAMKESHKDKKAYQKRMLAELQAELECVQNRLDVMYLDRLDGKVESAYYDRKHREWRREVEKIQKKMVKHNNANDCYLDEGIQLLELVQHAVDTYKVLVLSDRGSFLKLVHSNSFWKDGLLTAEYRQPFDFIAKTNAEYAQKMAVSREKNDHCLVWLPFTDSNHGQGD
jgi:hypothetical protein